MKDCKDCKFFNTNTLVKMCTRFATTDKDSTDTTGNFFCSDSRYSVNPNFCGKNATFFVQKA